MNYEPNTTVWKSGDYVIHDSDAKHENMLMKVTHVNKDGSFSTRYIFPNAYRRGFPGGKLYRNDMMYLHDPARFEIDVKAARKKLDEMWGNTGELNAK